MLGLTAPTELNSLLAADSLCWGTTVSPAFDPEDYEHGGRAALLRDYPDCADMIIALTPGGEQ